MQEFSSISVSTYDPDSLTGLLNEQSAAGWSVVSIVPTGSTVTAYLSRDAADAEAAEAPPAEAASEPEVAHDPVPVADDTSASEPAPEAEPVPEPAAAITPEPAPEPAAEPAVEPALPTAASEPAAEVAPAAAASSAAPAGWYADPSSRYELRYWDGSTWTEHVSRAGQQYTDPPVA